MSENPLCVFPGCETRLHDFSGCSEVKIGGQGSIYVTQDQSKRRFCKKVVPRLAQYTAKEAAYALNAVKSPFLIDYLHVFHTSEKTVFIQDWCEAGSLADFLRKRSSFRFSSSDVGRILCQLLVAIHALHSHGYVHRDIKPANVLLTSNESPFSIKICDLGVCKNLYSEDAASTVGTFYYMAPEQLSTKSGESYSFGVDLWAIGTVLFELCEGRKAFMDIPDVLQADIPRSNTEWGPIISRLLVRNPANRAKLDEILSIPLVHRHMMQLMENSQSLEHRVLTRECFLLSKSISSLQAAVKELAQNQSASSSNAAEELKASVLKQNEMILEQRKALELCHGTITQLIRQVSVRKSTTSNVNNSPPPLPSIGLSNNTTDVQRSCFFSCTKGQNLTLNDDSTILSKTSLSVDEFAASFCYVMHPKRASLKFKLIVPVDRPHPLASRIGLFAVTNPNKAETFVGVFFKSRGISFLDKTSKDRIGAIDYGKGCDLVLEFTDSSVSFTIPQLSWQRQVNCSVGYALGVDLGYCGESWCLE
ncbi:hypothetical protein RCL1_002998 [Eukaryota sp. TZLM3-RCL]